MTILCVRFQLPPTRETALPELLGLLEEFTPVVEALPPDRALADLRGAERYFKRDAVELASVIRVRALALHGVDCAIGAGPGPMLARMALKDARPGVTCAVTGDTVADFLAGRPVAALPGVGGATARVLCEYGLDTLGRVAAAPLSTLQRLVGAKAGRELHEKANGVDRGRVVPNGVSRSLATERPFTRDELDPDRHRRALLSAAEELGARLRALDKVRGPRSPARPGPLRRPARRGPRPRRTGLPPAHLRPHRRQAPPHRGGRGPRPREVRAAGGAAGNPGRVGQLAHGGVMRVPSVSSASRPMEVVTQVRAV
jgi:nucleotidyltransferase/DNA polymerase involved in DNA repair